MGYIPCCNCHRDDKGRLLYAYLATFEDKQRVSWRLRLCSVCFEAFIPDLLTVADRDDGTGRWLSPEQR